MILATLKMLQLQGQLHEHPYSAALYGFKINDTLQTLEHKRMKTFTEGVEIY